MQILGSTLLCINQADSSPANKTINIGYLLQFMDMAGAINVAIEQAQNDGLLRDYNFRYNATQIGQNRSPDLTVRFIMPNIRRPTTCEVCATVN